MKKRCCKKINWKRKIKETRKQNQMIQFINLYGKLVWMKRKHWFVYRACEYLEDDEYIWE